MIAVSIVALVCMGIVAAQVPRDATGNPQIYRVASLDDLKTQTADHIAQAEAFGSLGHFGKLAEGRRIQFQSTGPRTAIAGLSEMETRAFLLRRTVCSASTIFLAQVESQKVMMNIRETWLFTEYTASAQSALKPASLAPTVRVSLPSGEADVAGQIYRTIGMPLLRVGHTYVVFVTAIPDSTAYNLVRAEEVGPLGDTTTQRRLHQLTQIVASCDQERPGAA